MIIFYQFRSYRLNLFYTQSILECINSAQCGNGEMCAANRTCAGKYMSRKLYGSSAKHYLLQRQFSIFNIWASCLFRPPLFDVQFLAVPPPPEARDPCGEFQPRILNDTTGTILSPNCPANYTGDQDCNWLLQTDETHAIQITIESFTTEAGWVPNI